jgi:hypothetical protein
VSECCERLLQVVVSLSAEHTRLGVVSRPLPLSTAHHAQLCGTSVAFAPGWLCVWRPSPAATRSSQQSAGMAVPSCGGCMHTAVRQGPRNNSSSSRGGFSVVEGGFKGEAGWLFGGAACLFVGALGLL